MIKEKKDIIWWQFDPFRFADIYFFSNTKRIYHIVDPYQHIESDKKIASNVDLLVIVSNYYKPYYIKFNKPLLYIPHGISSSEFQMEESKLIEIERKYGRNFILYVGTINEDVDSELLKKLVEELQNYKLLIIGPITSHDKASFDKICQMKNVNYIEKVSSRLIKYYCFLCKVGIVPYKKKLTENVHRTPLKIMNYIAQKKPVVTTINYELKELNNKIIFTDYSSKDFIKRVKSIMENKTTIASKEAEYYISKISYADLINLVFNNLYQTV